MEDWEVNNAAFETTLAASLWTAADTTVSVVLLRRLLMVDTSEGPFVVAFVKNT